MKLTTRKEYEDRNLATRAERMRWWKEARFGMFVHFGLYSILGRHEWAMATECIPKEEYERLTEQFQPRPGKARDWARLAKRAGMKYMVFTTKHHDGYCLWDTKQTEFNSVRTGPKRDLVAEYVAACREEGLQVGLYYSLMDWHHPDGGACHYDPEARRRFLEFTRGCVRELMSNYGQIDVLWYDIPKPLDNPEGWESDAMNQMVRSLQPGILINDRSQLPEDFSTPEGEVKPAKVERERGWEACMTFNGSTWGYMPGWEVDAWRARDIVKMLGTATSQQGNLLLNIGPLPDGSVPPEVVEPLESVGRWLVRHGEAVYGEIDSFCGFPTFCGPVSRKASVLYFWRQIWAGTEQGLGGYETELKSVTCVTTGKPVHFTQEGYRIRLLDLPEKCPEPEAGVTIFKLEFAAEPVFKWLPTTPAVVAGW
jgi:alpha-L-fucosidase